MASFWKQFQWAVWAVLTLAFTAVLVIFRGVFVRSSDAEKRIALPPVPPQLRKQVEKAEEAALVAKATAAVKSNEHRQQLAEIAAVDDGRERRKQLASFLRGL